MIDDEFNYSDEQYDLSKSEKFEIEDNSHDEQIGVKILTLQQMFEIFESQVKEVEDICDFSQDSLIELFGDFNWNKDKLIETLFSSPERQKQIQEILRAKGFINIEDKDIKLYQFTKIGDGNAQEVCPVCLEDLAKQKMFLNLICGHQFCKTCWIQHIISANHEGNPFIKCMYQKCQIKVPYSFVLEVAEPDLSLVEDYRISLCRKFTQGNKGIQFCPGVNCKYFIISKDIAASKIICKCGMIFCFICRQEYHRPASCEMIQKWNSSQRSNDLSLTWIRINTKVCPFCHKQVQRSMGCNYMRCLPPGGCGGVFCYLCQQPWGNDHQSHFECNKYVEEDGEQKHLQQFTQNTIGFYQDRFTSSEVARDVTVSVKKNLHLNLQIIFDVLKLDYRECSFLEKALNEIIDSRQVLKWSYCFAYYLQVSHKKQIDLFKNFQKQFDSACESLTIQVLQFFDFIQQIQKINISSTLFLKYNSEFRQMRSEIIHQTKYCETYKLNLLECIDSGQIFVEL